MKIRFEKAKMLEKLVRAMGAVSSKNTHPFTEGVLLETAGNRLKLSTYDMEKRPRLHRGGDSDRGRLRHQCAAPAQHRAHPA